MVKVQEGRKVADVVFIFKKDGMDKIKIYWSVSLMSAIGKLLEKILRDGIL